MDGLRLKASLKGCNRFVDTPESTALILTAAILILKSSNSLATTCQWLRNAPEQPTGALTDEFEGWWTNEARGPP